MNLYEKLAQARIDLQNMGLSKSGYNKFAGYKYFELRDFLPSVNELMVKYKLLSVCRFDHSMASLTIVDAEKPDVQVVFTCPMSEAELKGCHAVQNLGAVQTYTRRYLYMNAFEIVESDALDSTQGKPTQTDDDPLGSGYSARRLPPRGGKQ